MNSWNKRTREVAHLLNPAFCGRMLYSAINAVKELNTKVINIAKRIESDRNRVANLKKDNAELNAQLDKLADEVTALETKKHK